MLINQSMQGQGGLLGIRPGPGVEASLVPRLQ